MPQEQAEALQKLLDDTLEAVGRRTKTGRVEIRSPIIGVNWSVVRSLVLAHILYINNIAIGLAGSTHKNQGPWSLDVVAWQDVSGVYIKIFIPGSIMGAVVGSGHKNIVSLRRLYAPLMAQARPPWVMIEVLDADKEHAAD